MTAQRREHLVYNNKEYYLTTEPLHLYLKDNNISVKCCTTNCWRGYVGYWSIEKNKLYLTDLKAYIENFQEVGLDYLFPDKKKVFAEWFSGEIRIPHGKMMKYIHQGYASLYETELFIKIEKGFVVDQYEIDNTHLYDDKAGMEARNMEDLIQAILGVKPRKIKPHKKKGILFRIIERMSNSLFKEK